MPQKYGVRTYTHQTPYSIHICNMPKPFISTILLMRAVKPNNTRTHTNSKWYCDWVFENHQNQMPVSHRRLCMICDIFGYILYKANPVGRRHRRWIISEFI